MADPAEILERIAAGEETTLHVERLRSLAGSLGELVRLLDWLERHGSSLRADNVGLDTRTPGGQRMVALLREIEQWGRHPEHPRRPRGRPGLRASAPHVAARITELRDQGLSLAAIAERLTDEGVPTPRGGERWRASSVQAALGYRRPPRPPHHAPRPPRPPRP